MRGSGMPGWLLVALLAASAGQAHAARIRAAAARVSGDVHWLLDRLHGRPSGTAPLNPTEAAVAVVDFFQAGGASGGGGAAAALRPACADFLARSVGGLNESWSDAQLEAALNDTCSERAMLAPGNGSAEHRDCLSFSSRLAGARRARAANGSSAGYAGVCEEYSVLVSKQGQEPYTDQQQAESDAESSGLFVMIIQIFFGITYYFTVVSKYPIVKEGDCEGKDAAKALQENNELMAVGGVSYANCVLSFCCPAARASHTFHSTETVNYWLACVLMTCFPWGPCCALFIANSCTPMNRKLGGEQKGILMGLLCTWCCGCCVIAQDAESMDLVVGAKTGLCSVTKVEG